MSLAMSSPEAPEKASKSAVAIAAKASGEAGSKVTRGFSLVACNTSVTSGAVVDENVSNPDMLVASPRVLLSEGIASDLGGERG